MIVVQGPLMSLIGDKVGEPALVTLGSVGMMISFVLLQSQALWLIYLAALCFALGNGVMWPSFLSILGGLGNESQRGYIQGISSSSGSFASIVGLTVGGVLYTIIGSKTFVIAGVIFGLVFLLSIYLRIQLSSD